MPERQKFVDMHSEPISLDHPQPRLHKVQETIWSRFLDLSLFQAHKSALAEWAHFLVPSRYQTYNAVTIA
jgi:hypothetical protein